jgi:hypothetical protein
MADPTTVDELKKRLTALAPGESLRLSSLNYKKLFEGQLNGWKGAGDLGREFGCTIQFEPDGLVVIVKEP